jgi:hypothetical protein
MLFVDCMPSAEQQASTLALHSQTPACECKRRYVSPLMSSRFARNTTESSVWKVHSLSLMRIYTYGGKTRPLPRLLSWCWANLLCSLRNTLFLCFFVALPVLYHQLRRFAWCLSWRIALCFHESRPKLKTTYGYFCIQLILRNNLKCGGRKLIRNEDNTERLKLVNAKSLVRLFIQLH